MAVSLKSIERGVDLKPPRIFLYATHGIGKSTWASKAPKPIFIPTEDGLGSIDVDRFPMAKSDTDVLDAISALYTEEHDYKTVVLDSADWLENMLIAKIESQYPAKDLAYGKSALLLVDNWRNILAGFDALRNDKKMTVIIIGHCEIKRFDSPETDSYDRYQPKLQVRISALIQEWADAVMFANYRVVVKKEDVGFNQRISRGISNGERLLYTQETPAFLAKNRYGLPPSLPFEWSEFEKAIIGGVYDK